MNIEIKSLSASALGALISAAEKHLAVFSARRPIVVVRRELVAVAASYGYQIDDLFGSGAVTPARRERRVRRKTVKVEPKYRDLDNKRNTWTGRGRQPRWLADKIRRGHAAADFLIPGIARPTAMKGSQVGKKSIYKQA